MSDPVRGSASPIAMAGDAERPITVLISALGGEGGGVLTSWIVNAARAGDLPVQATSIPGVAQRTGSTTYYIEIWPRTWSALAGRAPVMALAPAMGEVDVFVASELLEAARALSGGFLTPDRTLVIAARDRVYTTREKMQMGDGRYDAEALEQAVRAHARRHVKLELAALAQASGASTNAVLLGAIAGAAGLPIQTKAFRQGILAEGKAAEINLRGFEAGLTAVGGEAGPAPDNRTDTTPDRAPKALTKLLARSQRDFPPEAQATLTLGLHRTADFQDAGYAALYLERMAPFAESGGELAETVARHLAVRMTFDDVYRVAQAKARPERLARIRAETGAEPGEPVHVTEFLKPGWEELCDAMPAFLARPLVAWGERRPRLQSIRWGMELRTTTVSGYLRLRLLAALRPLRRISWRYRREQEAIGQWLDWVHKGAALHPELGREIAECARLIKGYGETHRRGVRSFERIANQRILPALNGNTEPLIAAQGIAAARVAALADPEGRNLDAALQA